MKHSSVKVCWLVCLLAMLTARFFELSFAIDISTGFYKIEYSAYLYISSAVIIISALAMLFFTYTDIEGFVETGFSKTVGVISVLLGISIGGSFVLTVADGMQGFIAIKALAELAACGAFLAYGIFIFLKRSLPDSAKLLFVPIWLTELIYNFIKNNDVSAVPEKIYDIIMLSLCLLFSLIVAKHSCGLLGQNKAKYFFWLGSVTSLFCIMGTLPRYIVGFVSGKDSLHANATSDPMYLLFGIFIAVYLLKSFKRANNE